MYPILICDFKIPRYRSSKARRFLLTNFYTYRSESVSEFIGA